MFVYFWYGEVLFKIKLFYFIKMINLGLINIYLILLSLKLQNILAQYWVEFSLFSNSLTNWL